MFKKTRDQADSDRLTQNVLTTRVTEMNKVFAQVESIRHLEATRHSTVDGMNANHRFIIERERGSWQNQLNLKMDLLRYE